jgi:hypothetical protein
VSNSELDTMTNLQRSKYWRFVRLPNSLGMGPVNSLNPTKPSIEKINCQKDPNNVTVSNSEPDTEANLQRSKCSSLVNLPNSVGMDPVNRLKSTTTVEEINYKTAPNNIIVSLRTGCGGKLTKNKKFELCQKTQLGW